MAASFLGAVFFCLFFAVICAISFNGQYYQLITDKLCLQFDGEKTIAVFDMLNDKFKNNLVNNISVNYQAEEKLLKAIIQTYNHTLIDNKMTVK
jgi:hypothetical protein